VLRRIFIPMIEYLTGGWGKLHNKKPYNLHSSPNTVRVIASRMMRWAERVRRMEKCVHIFFGRAEEGR